MKTNTIQVILTSVIIGAIALAFADKLAANFNVIAAGVSSIAVVILTAVAAVDYRGVKGYAAR